MTINDENHHHDQTLELKKQFDDSKTGVKGLVDRGITSIPTFFRFTPESLSDIKPIDGGAPTDADPIPVVDLSGHRPTVVDEIRRAAADFGFFQIVNHGIPPDVLERTIAAVRAFHEGPAEIKTRMYGRGGPGASFFSNVDLFKAKAASWRDTIQVTLGARAGDPAGIPEICREEVVGWDGEAERVGEAVMGLLSEGLGLREGRLKELSCTGGRVMVGHYYPRCPEPEQTMGLVSHTDPGVLTLLLQDLHGGLQIKHRGEWVNVKPLPGALVVNVGDLLQIMSNDAYKSVDHRVVANRSHEPRVSIAVFMNPADRDSLYGPLPELVTPEEPAHYRSFTASDFLSRFFTKELDGHSLRGYYMLLDARGKGTAELMAATVSPN